MSEAIVIVNEMLDEEWHDGWQPSSFILNWFRQFIGMQRDGSMWASPTSGLVYRVDKTNKTLTLTAGDPNDERNWHKKNIVTLAKLGWRVLPNTLDRGSDQTSFAESEEDVDPKEYALDKVNPQWVYHSIVFLSGDEATEPLEILDQRGEDAAIEYLAQWDYGGEIEHSPSTEKPWGTADRVYKTDAGDGQTYFLTWSSRQGYIGLTRGKEHIYGIPD